MTEDFFTETARRRSHVTIVTEDFLAATKHVDRTASTGIQSPTRYDVFTETARLLITVTELASTSNNNTLHGMEVNVLTVEQAG